MSIDRRTRLMKDVRPHSVEEVLHRVREVRHPVETEHPARPLQGVGRTEDLLEELFVVGLLLETNEVFIKELDQSFSLLEEDFEIVGADFGSSCHPGLRLS